VVRRREPNRAVLEEGGCQGETGEQAAAAQLLAEVHRHIDLGGTKASPTNLGRKAPGAPTWIVAWDDFNNWQLDPTGQFATEIAQHYHAVGDICGAQVWLHRGISRRLAAPPTDCDPAFGES
jgi:hypothetical protein